MKKAKPPAPGPVLSPPMRQLVKSLTAACGDAGCAVTQRRWLDQAGGYYCTADNKWRYAVAMLIRVGAVEAQGKSMGRRYRRAGTTWPFRPETDGAHKGTRGPIHCKPPQAKGNAVSRDCLVCRRSFIAHNKLIFVCDPCKASKAWRDGTGGNCGIPNGGHRVQPCPRSA